MALTDRRSAHFSPCPCILPLSRLSLVSLSLCRFFPHLRVRCWSSHLCALPSQAARCCRSLLRLLSSSRLSFTFQACNFQLATLSLSIEPVLVCGALDRRSLSVSPILAVSWIVHGAATMQRACSGGDGGCSRDSSQARKPETARATMLPSAAAAVSSRV